MFGRKKKRNKGQPLPSLCKEKDDYKGPNLDGDECDGDRGLSIGMGTVACGVRFKRMFPASYMKCLVYRADLSLYFLWASLPRFLSSNSHDDTK